MPRFVRERAMAKPTRTAYQLEELLSDRCARAGLDVRDVTIAAGKDGDWQAKNGKLTSEAHALRFDGIVQMMRNEFDLER